MKLYGIKNCDTVKKARRWLDTNGVTYTFHDVRADGLDEATLRGWLDTVTWETLLNKRGTTWRQLDDPRKDHLTAVQAIELMLTHPTLIKRPVIETETQCTVGFNEQTYTETFLN
jgi:arsenate reductase